MSIARMLMKLKCQFSHIMLFPKLPFEIFKSNKTFYFMESKQLVKSRLHSKDNYTDTKFRMYIHV